MTSPKTTRHTALCCTNNGLCLSFLIDADNNSTMASNKKSVEEKYISNLTVDDVKEVDVMKLLMNHNNGGTVAKKSEVLADLVAGRTNLMQACLTDIQVKAATLLPTDKKTMSDCVKKGREEITKMYYDIGVLLLSWEEMTVTNL